MTIIDSPESYQHECKKGVRVHLGDKPTARLISFPGYRRVLYAISTLDLWSSGVSKRRQHKRKVAAASTNVRGAAASGRGSMATAPILDSKATNLEIRGFRNHLIYSFPPWYPHVHSLRPTVRSIVHALAFYCHQDGSRTSFLTQF